MTHDSHPHQDCLKMFEKLSEYIDKEVDEMTCREIERHAKSCIRCEVCLEMLKRAVELCRRVESHPVPESLSARLKAMLQSMT